MKDKSILDAAGPLFITGCLVAVLAVAAWIMLEYQGDWGQGVPEATAAAPADAH